MPSKGYSVGESVMVKWPGSALWYPAMILSIEDDEYKVRFEEGTEDEVTAESIRVSLE